MLRVRLFYPVFNANSQGALKFISRTITGSSDAPNSLNCTLNKYATLLQLNDTVLKFMFSMQL